MLYGLTNLEEAMDKVQKIEDKSWVIRSLLDPRINFRFTPSIYATNPNFFTFTNNYHPNLTQPITQAQWPTTIPTFTHITPIQIFYLLKPKWPHSIKH